MNTESLQGEQPRLRLVGSRELQLEQPLSRACTEALGFDALPWLLARVVDESGAHARLAPAETEGSKALFFTATFDSGGRWTLRAEPIADYPRGWSLSLTPTSERRGAAEIALFESGDFPFFEFGTGDSGIVRCEIGQDGRLFSRNGRRVWSAWAGVQFPPAGPPHGGALVIRSRIDGEARMLSPATLPLAALAGEAVIDPSFDQRADGENCDTFDVQGVRFHAARRHPTDDEGLTPFSSLSALQSALRDMIGSLRANGESHPTPALRLFRDGRPQASQQAARAALLLAPFLPRFVIDWREGRRDRFPPRRPLGLRHFLGTAPEAYLAYLGLRMAFLPLRAHLAVQELASGFPAWRSLLDDPRLLDIPEALAAPLQFLVGNDLLVGADIRHEGQGTATVYLPPGSEWIDYWTGRRYQGDQLVTAPPPLARLPLYVRLGATMPLFDLSVRTARASSDALLPGPPERILLKIFPGVDREHVLFDVFGRRPLGDNIDLGRLADIPILRVRHRSTTGRVEIEVEARPAPLLLMVKCHRPQRVTAGPDRSHMSPLASVEREEAFDRVEDCWMYHPHRDEVLVKSRIDGIECIHLAIDFEK